jgi:hypothetical protein
MSLQIPSPLRETCVKVVVAWRGECMVHDEEALVLLSFLPILLGWQFYPISDFIF